MRNALLLLVMIGCTSTMGEELSVWYGTRGSAKGIYRSAFNSKNGKLSEAMLAFEIQDSGFLAIDEDARRLYSIGSTDQAPDDNLASFRIESGGSLKLIGTANSSGGKPTHISLSRDRGTLLVAHYSGGGVATLPIGDDGVLGKPVVNIRHDGSSVNKERQKEPHPHWIGVTPDNHFAVVPDLGKDQVVIYKFDAESHSLTPHGHGTVPPGAGPRHLKFHPTKPWAYVINELDLTVTGFKYGASAGTLDAIETVAALPMSEVKEILTSGSEIRIHPNGKFLYAGIRGHDVVVVFSIDESGKLELVEREPIRGSWPRNFVLSPSGDWLIAAGAESSTISVFKVDAESGKLTFTRQIIHVPECICVAFSR